jgi:hypothetical protein
MIACSSRTPSQRHHRCNGNTVFVQRRAVLSPYEHRIAFATMCDNGERRRIVLMAVARYHNVATNDGQDGPFDAPTRIRHRYVATSHSPTPYYCQRQTAAAHRRRRRGGALSVRCWRFRKHAGGYRDRAALFLSSNAFRLPACRIVPVPYITPYGPVTILHAGFVPYVRCTYVVRTSWFCRVYGTYAFVIHQFSQQH